MRKRADEHTNAKGASTDQGDGTAAPVSHGETKEKELRRESSGE
jgi:hypothetical protein